MDDEFLEDQAQVSFIDGNEIIQTFASNGPNKSFAEGICFGRSNRGSDRPHAEILQRRIKRGRENGIAIVNDEFVRMRIGEDLPELLRGPFGGRMTRHVEVQNPPRSDLHRYEYIEDLKGRGDRHEEVAGHDSLGMVPNKRRPALVVASASGPLLRQVLPNGPWRHEDSEFEIQLIGDPLLAPGWIVASHLADQFLQILRQRRTTCLP